MTSGTPLSEDLRRAQNQFRGTERQAQALPMCRGLETSVYQSGFVELVDLTARRCCGLGSIGGLVTAYRHDSTRKTHPRGC